MGPLTGQVGTYFGVELDTATGKNDGSHNGK
jgi:dynactin complex subunit